MARKCDDCILRNDKLFKFLFDPIPKMVTKGKKDFSLLEEIETENDRYNQKLRAKAKKSEELTIGLECTVLEVNGYQDSTSFTPRSEMMMGGSSPSYGGGHVYQTEIKVKSETLVEKLEFAGWPNLEAGDTIRAYILKGQEEAEQGFGGRFNDYPKTHLVERDYWPVERPTKIEKLRDGKVAATYHNR